MILDTGSHLFLVFFFVFSVLQSHFSEGFVFGCTDARELPWSVYKYESQALLCCHKLSRLCGDYSLDAVSASRVIYAGVWYWLVYQNLREIFKQISKFCHDKMCFLSDIVQYECLLLLLLVVIEPGTSISGTHTKISSVVCILIQKWCYMYSTYVHYNYYYNALTVRYKNKSYI